MNLFYRLSILFGKDVITKICEIVYKIGKPFITALQPVIFSYYSKMNYKFSNNVIEKIKTHIVELYLEINKTSTLKNKDKLWLLLSLLKEKILNELEVENLYKECKEMIKKELESDSLWLYLIQVVILEIKRDK